MTVTKFGYHNGRLEKEPGKLKYRMKGWFNTEAAARRAQERLREEGETTKVQYLESPDGKNGYALYVLAKHDFWKKDFWTG